MKGFLEFIRQQGVVGLAVGFILGGSVSKVVTSIVTDLINPILGLILGKAGDLKSYNLVLGDVKIMWGNFASNVIDFLVIAAVVYFVVKGFGFDKIDKKS